MDWKMLSGIYAVESLVGNVWTRICRVVFVK